MRRKGFVIDECDRINTRATDKPPISFDPLPGSAGVQCRCGHFEPKPRTRNQRQNCNACADKARWGKWGTR